MEVKAVYPAKESGIVGKEKGETKDQSMGGGGAEVKGRLCKRGEGNGREKVFKDTERGRRKGGGTIEERECKQKTERGQKKEILRGIRR